MSLKESRIARLLRWRANNPETYEEVRLKAVRESERIKQAAREVAREYAEKAKATKRKMPMYQKGEQHVRASVWRFRSPTNTIYEFKNLAEFLRRHGNLFAVEDLNWQRVGTTEICRAYKGLAALRPYLADGTPRKRVEGSWKGWRWLGSKGVEEQP